jgi:hypothetical protein
VHRVQPPAETHRVSAVPFCAYENTQQTSGNTGDSLEMIAGIHLELCLFVPTTISAIARKLLKRFGVPNQHFLNPELLALHGLLERIGVSDDAGSAVETR